jgi:hypothetical protein|tara:strand:- start:255 stop:998 length:744 start_codon:yes stop_codon:yes gene_type:complete
MALSDNYELKEEEIQTTAEERDEAFQDLYGKTSEQYFDEQGFGDGVTQQGADAAYFAMQAADEKAKEAARERIGREKYGLTGDKIYDYATKLSEIAEGQRKTEGQIEAEKQLEILSKAQRGRAMGLGGFNTAELLQGAGRSAQQAELGGETAIAQVARQSQLAAEDQLEQLLIAGEQRAEDRAFAMQQLAFQQEQASGSLWSNVLGGVLGAVGAVVGAVVPGGGAAGALVGSAIGSATGKGAGRYLG